jgi:hypothetical protein
MPEPQYEPRPRTARPHSGQARWSASIRCPHPAQPRWGPHDGHDSSAGPRTPCEEQYGQKSMPAPRSRERTRRGKTSVAANIDNPPDALASAAITRTPDARPPHPSRRTTVPATPTAPSTLAAHSLLRRRVRVTARIVFGLWAILISRRGGPMLPSALGSTDGRTMPLRVSGGKGGEAH